MDCDSFDLEITKNARICSVAALVESKSFSRDLRERFARDLLAFAMGIAHCRSAPKFTSIDESGDLLR
jgi:hypothetical protein